MRAFVERYERRLFPLPQITTAQTMWRSYRNIVRVTLWGRDHFRNNVHAAMVRESLGLGPQYYCIMWFGHSGFAKRVFLLIQFLPHAKMCLYPYFGLLLRGPFEQSPHTREIRDAISLLIVPFEELALMCQACDSCFCDHVMEGLVEL